MGVEGIETSFFCTSRNPQHFYDDSGPNNILSLSFVGVNDLLLPMKMSQELVQWSRAWGGTASFPCPGSSWYPVWLLAGFWQGKLVIEEQETSSITAFF
jgi:hypothetical protein